jgi:SulP family sulfate permease
MPSLAALLILIGVRTFKADQIVMVWRTGSTQATVFAVTFVLALVIPLQYAVLTGVAISIVLYVARQSNKVVVRRWEFIASSPHPIEVDPPSVIGSHEVIVLVPYGSLFFAAAPVLESQLPAVTSESSRSVVLIRLRGKDELGSTFINTLSRYADTLTAAGCRLMLVGVGDDVARQLRLTGALRSVGEHNVIAATPELTKSVRAGVAEARSWIEASPGPGPVNGL